MIFEFIVIGLLIYIANEIKPFVSQYTKNKPDKMLKDINTDLKQILHLMQDEILKDIKPEFDHEAHIRALRRGE